jgi:hypothetical protein
MRSAPRFDDLRALVSAAGPFITIVIPAPSRFPDAAHRFDVEWQNARRRFSGQWADDVEALDEAVSALDHGEGASLVVVRARGGPTLIEFLDHPVTEAVAVEGPLPQLVTLLEARQRAVAHVVVETDRAGADLVAFDRGGMASIDQVEGDTLHIHRGHPGGWSQRRFQQRAENTWERNADDVATAVAAMAREVDAELVAVAGDVRAQTLVLESLPHDVAQTAVKIEAGSADGIAEDVLRLVSNIVARHIRDLVDQFRSALAAGNGTDGIDDTLAALREGRVGTLLVHDDGDDGPTTEQDEIPAGARVVDAAVALALRTDAQIVVVPRLAAMPGPIAALLRW